MWLLSYLSNDLGLSADLCKLVWKELSSERTGYEATQQLRLDYGRLAMNEYGIHGKHLERALDCSGHVMIVRTFWEKTTHSVFSVQAAFGDYCYYFQPLMGRNNNEWDQMTKERWHELLLVTLKMRSVLAQLLTYLEHRYGYWMHEDVSRMIFNKSVLDCHIAHLGGAAFNPEYTGFLCIGEDRYSFQRKLSTGEWQFLGHGKPVDWETVRNDIANHVNSLVRSCKEIIRYPNWRRANLKLIPDTAKLIQTLNQEAAERKARARDLSPLRKPKPIN